MLITFHSKVVAEVLMLTDHAGALLQAAGKSFGDKIPERGVFTVEQLQPAISGIERAIDDYQRAHEAPTKRTRTSARVPDGPHGGHEGARLPAAGHDAPVAGGRRGSHLGGVARLVGGRANVAGPTICPAVFCLRFSPDAL